MKNEKGARAADAFRVSERMLSEDNPWSPVSEKLWQGRRDSNTQPSVLETDALPLSHSPKLETSVIINQFILSRQ